MLKNQPKIDVELSAFDKKLITFGWVLIGLNFLIVLVAYLNLPDIIPIHFNLKGEADGYGDKSSIWLIPIISAVTYWGMTAILTKIKPWNYNYPIKVTEKNAETVYGMTKQMMVRLNLGFAILFMAVTLQILLNSNGRESHTFWILAPFILFLTLYPIYVILKMFKISK